MKKLFAAILLALAALCLLASCGDDPNPGPGPSTEKDYTVTFVVGTTKTEVGVDEGEVPTAPTKAPRGYVIAGWDKTIVSAKEDTTYTAILTDESRVNKEILMSAYNTAIITQDLKDTSSAAPGTFVYPVANNNAWGMLTGASAAFTLALEEYENPQGGPVRDRLLAHLKSITFDGNAPTLDNLPIWSTPALTAMIALCKLTPTVWDSLPAGTEERLDCIMRAFCAVVSFGSADWNSFETGPGLQGNYKKNWNINYGLSNVLPIYNAVIYFGTDTEEDEYSVKDGAAAVNQILRDFDYDTYIAEFEEYGFTAPLAVWTSDKGTAIAGRVEQLMMNGDSTGTLAHLVPGSNAGSSCGTGKGVRIPSGYTEFRYTLNGVNYGLEDIVNVFRGCTAWCFSGGTITSTGSDGRGYTISDATGNPMLGRNGLFAELNQGTSRSSLTYSRDDMIQYQAELCFLVALGLYDLEENQDMVQLGCNGINDMIYKFVKGYHSFAGATDSGTDNYDSNYGGYYYMRALHIVYIGDDTMTYLLPDSLITK